MAAWTAEDTIVSAVHKPARRKRRSRASTTGSSSSTRPRFRGISSVAQTASLLAGGGIDFQVLHGLGLAGQVLVRSSARDLDAVEGFFRNDAYVASFEQDAVRQAQVHAQRPADWQASGP